MGVIIFWGVSFVATKMALETIPLFTLIFLRFLVSALILLILMMRLEMPAFTRREHLKMLLLALFDPGLYFIFETIGLKYTSAANASLIIATVPLAVLMLSMLFLKERTSPRGIAGIFLSIIGIAILMSGDPKFAWELSGHALGDLMVFGAVFSAAFYSIFSRSLGQNHSSLKITAVQFIYGTIFYIPAFLWEFPGLQWASISVRSWGALAYLTFFATIGAFLCYNYALSKLPATRAAIFINGIPVVTALAAWLILGEKLTLIQAGGGALVLFAVGLTNWPNNHRESRELEQTLPIS